MDVCWVRSIVLVVLLVVWCDGGASFSYVLDNECSVNLEHSIMVPPARQEETFNIISLPISDARMIPPNCRRPLLWMVCNLAFPPTNQNCQITQQDCEFVVDECGEDIVPFNCSGFGGGGGKEEEEEEEGGREGGTTDSDFGFCKVVEEVIVEENPVVTCLEEVGEEIECCIEPFIRDSETSECVLGCPIYPWSKSNFLGLSYAGFVLTWVGIASCFFAFFPLFIRDRPKFPRVLFPVGLITASLWNHSFYLAIYRGPISQFCQNEDNFIIARENYIDSTFCHATAMVFSGLGLGVSVVLVCAAGSFAVLCATMTASEGKRQEIMDTVEKPIFVIIVLSFVGGAMFQYGLIHADVDKYISLSYGFGCVAGMSIENPYMATCISLFAANILCQIIGFILVARRSLHLLTAMQSLVVFLIAMDYALLMVSLNNCLFVPRDEETFEKGVEEYAFCVASQPRDENPDCTFDSGDYFAFQVIFVVTMSLLQPFVIWILYPIRLLCRWWYICIFEQKILSMEELTTNSSGSTKGLTQSYERDDKTVSPREE